MYEVKTDLCQAAPQQILVRVDLDSSAVQYKTTHQLAKPSQSEGCQKQSDKSLTRCSRSSTHLTSLTRLGSPKQGSRDSDEMR